MCVCVRVRVRAHACARACVCVCVCVSGQEFALYIIIIIVSGAHDGSPAPLKQKLKTMNVISSATPKLPPRRHLTFWFSDFDSEFKKKKKKKKRLV